MRADGAHLGSILADDDMAAVGALPDHVAVAGEHKAALNIRQQLAVAVFVLTLDLSHFFKQESQVVKALFLGVLRHLGIHIGPLVILALGGVQQVVGRAGNGVAVQRLEPQLGVLLLIGSGLFKDLCNLNITVFARFGCIERVLVAGLALTGKRGPQIFFGFCSFQFHLITLLLLSCDFYVQPQRGFRQNQRGLTPCPLWHTPGTSRGTQCREKHRSTRSGVPRPRPAQRSRTRVRLRNSRTGCI